MGTGTWAVPQEPVPMTIIFLNDSLQWPKYINGTCILRVIGIFVEEYLHMLWKMTNFVSKIQTQR